MARRDLSSLEPEDSREISEAALALTRCLESMKNGDGQVMDHLRPVFLAVLADCCVREGISGYSSPEEEAALKDRLPDTVANWISALSALFGDSGASMRFIGPEETAAALLLRILEWKLLNYSGQFLYGRDQEDRARRIFESLAFELEMWGDMDEACHLFVEAAAGCTPIRGRVEVVPAVKYIALSLPAATGDLVMAARLAAFDRLSVRFGPESDPGLTCLVDNFRSSLRLGTPARDD